MKEMYKIAGISKQAMWSHNRREMGRVSQVSDVVREMNKIRGEHKRMGCRHMYFICKEHTPVGRDAFERIGLENGFRLVRKRKINKPPGASEWKFIQIE